MPVNVEYGSFYDTLYQKYLDREEKKTTVGAKMVLDFQPTLYKVKKLVTGVAEFNLVQIVKEIIGPGGEARQGNAGYLQRKAANDWAIDMDWQSEWKGGYQAIANARKSDLEQGQANADFKWQLDVDQVIETSKKAGTVLTSLDPRYAQQRISQSIPPFTTKSEGTGGNALVLTPDYKFPPAGNRASLRDNPSVPIDCNVIGMNFQVAVLLDYGEATSRQSRYLGSVSWGWQRPSGMGDVQIRELEQVDPSGASQEFLAAAAHWNALTVDDPAQIHGQSHSVFRLPVQ